eukprot:1156289-Pelagomonas_calceolata.AAC.1
MPLNNALELQQDSSYTQAGFFDTETGIGTSTTLPEVLQLNFGIAMVSRTADAAAYIIYAGSQCSKFLAGVHLFTIDKQQALFPTATFMVKDQRTWQKQGTRSAPLTPSPRPGPPAQQEWAPGRSCSPCPSACLAG